MDISQVHNLNSQLAKIQAESTKSEARRDALRTQLEQSVAQADKNHSFGLAVALEEGIPALFEKLRKLHASESEQLEQNVAHATKFVELYQNGDFAGMRKLLGQDEDAAAIMAEVQASEAKAAEEAAAEKAAQAEAAEVEAPVEDLEDRFSTPDAAVPARRPASPLAEPVAAAVEEEAPARAEVPKADLTALFGAPAKAEEVAPEAAPVAEVAEAPAEAPAKKVDFSSMFDDDDDAPAAKPTKGQTITDAFSDDGDDEDATPAFDFGNLVDGTKFGN